VTTETESLRHQATRGALWTFLQTGYVNVATLVSMVVLARLLSPDEFGIVSLAAVFVTLVTLVTDLGLTPALIRRRDPTDLQLNTAFWTSLLLSCVLAAALILSAPTIAAALHEPRTGVVLAVLAVQIPVASLRLVPLSTLTRQMRFKALAVRQVAATTIGTVGAIILAAAGQGVWALVFQSMGGVAIDVAILWWSVAWRPRLAFSLSESKELLSFGLPALATQAVHLGRDNGVDLIVGAMLGTHALGVWTVATRIARTILRLFATVLNTVALPTFAHVQGDHDRLVRALRRAVRATAGIAVPGMIGLAAISPTAITLVFGNRWSVSSQVAEVTAIMAAITVVQWLDGNVWWAFGRPGIEFNLTLAISLAHLLAAIVAAHYGGVMAVAWALLARTLLSVPLRVLVLHRCGRIPLGVYADVPRLLACCLPMYAVVWLIAHRLSALPQVAVLGTEVVAGAGLYLAASWWLQRRILTELGADVRTAVRRRRPDSPTPTGAR